MTKWNEREWYKRQARSALSEEPTNTIRLHVFLNKELDYYEIEKELIAIGKELGCNYKTVSYESKYKIVGDLQPITHKKKCHLRLV